MMPAFHPSTSMFQPSSPGFSPQNNPSVPGLGNAFGVPPEVLDRLRQMLMAQQAGSPEQAAVLRQQLLAVPGVREKLMQMQNPQNPNVQPVMPPPGGMQAATMPMGGAAPPTIGGDPTRGTVIPTGLGGELGPPTIGGDPGRGGTTVPTHLGGELGPPTIGGGGPIKPIQPGGGPTPVDSGDNPHRFQGRLKHGKGLPPGQERRANQGRFGMQSKPSTGLQAPPSPVAPPASGGGGFMDYRMRRMTGQGRGTAI